jgi:two-component system cell cycle response regulator
MRILIAEDHPHLGLLLREQLRPWGYEAVLVHDGCAALEAICAADAPRLALLDWLMPGMDGIEVCRRIRAESADSYAYLILMTGQGGRQQMLEGLEAGADEFLTKPVEPAELKARLGSGRRIIDMQEQLRDQASRDGLTGLWNRAATLNILTRELDRAQREGQPLAVVLADLDHFKRINDTFGHLAGDGVLRHTARRMLGSLRPYDVVGRYGGEEFLIILPGCGSAAALGLAERLRRCVGADPVEAEGADVSVTLSLGVAVTDGQANPDAVELLRAADMALYAAKRAGRNCVQLDGATVRLDGTFHGMKPHFLWGERGHMLASVP